MKIAQAETASNHFHFVVEDSLAIPLHEKIRNYMEGHPRKPDWTIGELAYGLELEKSTISARRNEMLHLCILERGEKRHCQISGVMCETVRLPRQLDLAQSVKEEDSVINDFAQLAKDMGV